VNTLNILKQNKVEPTKSRVEIVNLIMQKNSPVDSNYLVSKSLNLNRVTIFRVLNYLTEKGVLKKLEFKEGKARYEVSLDDHHHLICNSCGKIEKLKGCILGNLMKLIKKKKNFLIKDHRLDFFGLCSSCQN
jgi:Fur family transcriptional regulator, ferric uptake regulator